MQVRAAKSGDERAARTRRSAPADIPAFFCVNVSLIADSGGCDLVLAIARRIMAVREGQIEVGESAWSGARSTLTFLAG